MEALKTNSKQVREQVLGHILNDATVHEVKSNIIAGFGHLNQPIYKMAYQWVEDGNQLVYDYQKEEFLNSLGINPEGKKYPTEKVRHLYAHLIANEISKWDFNDYQRSN